MEKKKKFFRTSEPFIDEILEQKVLCIGTLAHLSFKYEHVCVMLMCLETAG